MINFQQEAIDRFVVSLKQNYCENYGLDKPEYGNVIGWIGQLALENIANTDALYHNMEHTMMVTQVAQAILRGKHLREGKVRPIDWLHYVVAALCHDIGYVRGICQDDREEHFATGIDGKMVKVSTGGTDAVMTPYHVDRSKLFVRERFSDVSIKKFNVERVCEYIELTRFDAQSLKRPVDPFDYPALTRAADFIGQLGDPYYLRKIPALFYEFYECGINEQIGYKNPQDMRKSYARFFWRTVSPHIQGALHYLSISYEGKQWTTSLYAHIFAVEHGASEANINGKKAVIYE